MRCRSSSSDPGSVPRCDMTPTKSAHGPRETHSSRRVNTGNPDTTGGRRRRDRHALNPHQRETMSFQRTPKNCDDDLSIYTVRVPEPWRRPCRETLGVSRSEPLDKSFSNSLLEYSVAQISALGHGRHPGTRPASIVSAITRAARDSACAASISAAATKLRDYEACLTRFGRSGRQHASCFSTSHKGKFCSLMHVQPSLTCVRR